MIAWMDCELPVADRPDLAVALHLALVEPGDDGRGVVWTALERFAAELAALGAVMWR
jgi:hypothetical protein